MGSREFLAHHLQDVVGLCLLDTKQERTYDERPINESAFGTLLEGLDYWAVVGAHESHKITNNDWQALIQNDASTHEYPGLEAKEYENSMYTLAAHKQFDSQVLGNYPISIVKANTSGKFGSSKLLQYKEGTSPRSNGLGAVVGI